MKQPEEVIKDGANIRLGYRRRAWYTLGWSRRFLLGVTIYKRGILAGAAVD
jgi:hypothetical protein